MGQIINLNAAMFRESDNFALCWIGIWFLVHHQSDYCRRKTTRRRSYRSRIRSEYTW